MSASYVPTPADLAREFRVSHVRVNGFLRERFPRAESDYHARWELTEEQVRVVRAYFAERRKLAASAGEHGGTPSAVVSPYRDEWFWEGNVQDVLVDHLRKRGWTVTTADTGRKEPGDDVRATRDGSILIVEVKGYPSRGYADPRRAGEVKRAQPTIQAHHWYADVLLHAVRSRHRRGNAAIAIGLPVFSRYLDLLGDTRSALEALGIGVLLVHESCEVEMFLRCGRQ